MWRLRVQWLTISGSGTHSRASKAEGDRVWVTCDRVFPESLLEEVVFELRHKYSSSPGTWTFEERVNAKQMTSVKALRQGQV